MAGSVMLCTVSDVNDFDRNPDVEDDKTDMLIHHPAKWWTLNAVMSNKQKQYIDLEHDNVAKNQNEIESWIKETFDYPVVICFHLETRTKTEETIRRIKHKGGMFSSEREEEIIETKEIETRHRMWRFHFRENSDAVLFTTAWKGEES